MKFNNQEYAKNILEMCENFYNDSNLPKIDLIEPILKECEPHNRYFMIKYKIKDLAELESIRLVKEN